MWGFEKKKMIFFFALAESVLVALEEGLLAVLLDDTAHALELLREVIQGRLAGADIAAFRRLGVGQLDLAEDGAGLIAHYV